MTNVTVPVGKAVVGAVASTGSDIGIADRSHPQPASERPLPVAGPRLAVDCSTFLGRQPEIDVLSSSSSTPAARHFGGAAAGSDAWMVHYITDGQPGTTGAN